MFMVWSGIKHGTALPLPCMHHSYSNRT